MMCQPEPCERLGKAGSARGIAGRILDVRVGSRRSYCLACGADGDLLADRDVPDSRARARGEKSPRNGRARPSPFGRWQATA